MMQLTLELENTRPQAQSLNDRIFAVLRAGVWWTPFEICTHLLMQGLMISDATCTARLRDLRKAQYGSHVIEKRQRVGSRAFEYRMVP